MAERWRPVRRWHHYPAGVFEASTEGNVRVLGELREPSADADGYLFVRYRGKRFYVAWLVALAHKGPPEVRHLAERTGNRPAELAYGSRWENEQDKKRKEKKEEKSYVTVRSGPVTHG